MPKLYQFEVQRPQREEHQEALLDWLALAHARAEAKKQSLPFQDAKIQNFHKEIRDRFYVLGLGEGKVKKRGAALADYFSQNCEEMEVYNVEERAGGRYLSVRMRYFDKTVSEVFRRFYSEAEAAYPAHLIHVTCTGYVSPSPAQKLVAEKGWGNHTSVTHAYHMGCYASIPAVQIALGYFHMSGARSDIVHTEFSGLHLNPSLHTSEQLVIESLFADGFIRYSLGRSEMKGLEILGILEEIIPDSAHYMTWHCGEGGFEMTIAKEVPVMIARHLLGYLERLAKKAQKALNEILKARFAIHPGGPKIIHQIAKKLALHPWQFCHSQTILQSCGNMSSATLPHVWNEMLEDEGVKQGELVVSLAFGPGLTFAGALFEKR